jgi:hypothetical protein
MAGDAERIFKGWNDLRRSRMWWSTNCITLPVRLFTARNGARAANGLGFATTENTNNNDE